jgi:FkbH-like protein
MVESENNKIYISELDNVFMSVYINDFVKKFRLYNSDEFIISIIGLKLFIPEGDSVLINFLKELKHHNITIENEGDNESIYEINITCKNVTRNTTYNFTNQIQNLPSLVELSARTDIPLVQIMIMKIVAQVLNKIKLLYKAIILDLDDTLWKGTLSEDGIDTIKENMISANGVPFIAFMKFVKRLGDELGIYIAICSRNNAITVESAIEKLDKNIFPLKNQIDYIIANNNDKSENIRLISEELSILQSSIIFIDDNQIVRDEVKSKLKDVFVPEWKNHIELLTKILTSCAFERNELSLNSQNRRKQYRIIKAERLQNALPKLSIKVINDEGNKESIKLFTKSNQFKFSSNNDNFNANASSIYFEIIRENDENLGICSAITYSHNNETFQIHNWALSCRYFEIGIEEYILLYIHNLARVNKILIDYNKSEHNQKVGELLAKYHDIFVFNENYSQIEIILNMESLNKIKQNTNLSTL